MMVTTSLLAKTCARYGQVMRRFVYVLALIAFASHPVIAQQPVSEINSDKTWGIRWAASDEFSGDSLDWRKWVEQSGLPETSSWNWDNAENIKLADGNAKISLRYGPKDGRHFSSGILKSYRTFTYGYFEARIQGIGWNASGACPAFWLFSGFDDDVAEGETIYCEIDVVELQQLDWYQGHQDDAHDIDLNLHCVVKQNGARQWRRPKRFPDHQLGKWRASWHPGDGFHVYGCEVNREEIIWFIDGAEIARKPNTNWHGEKHVAVSLGLRKPFVTFHNNRNLPVDPMQSPEVKSRLKEFPVSMLVDYVRVWEGE
ncbi:family 16 glycosylhydrolase [Roseiconus nitratireducens]|uniref:Family 16 glycosylhydrolase n=2 Tax=Roseiconus nitratireducens TaxID=2605748 RepID=A0A5M6DEC7_9BACT|nr:family 16 glycosylhydrolase [Roseiconus nitratireducens]